MLKAQHGTRWWALMSLVGIVFATTLMLITSGNPLQTSVLPQFCAGAPAPVPSSGFPQPQVRRSLNGQLMTDLHACIATNLMLDENQIPPVTVQFNPPTFEGTIPGPTLSVKPGDRLLIRVLNNLPVNPANERGGAFPHNENTLNIHTHGLTVSPGPGISDNIYREMSPGTINLIQSSSPRIIRLAPTGTMCTSMDRRRFNSSAVWPVS